MMDTCPDYAAVQNEVENPSWCGGFTHASYGDLTDELQKINDTKCIAAVNQLKILIGKNCHVDACDAKIISIQHFTLQYCLKLEWVCSNNHRQIWYSSPFYAAGLVINYLVDTSLLLSGGTVTQFKRFCNFINLGKCSSTSFYRNQRLYVSPTVDQEFLEMRERLS